MPIDIKYEILGYLLNEDNDSIKGFLSLRQTNKANNELCDDLANFKLITNTKITKNNVAEIYKVAQKFNNISKMKQCNRFMLSNVRPPWVKTYHTFCCLIRSSGYSDRRIADIKKKYGLAEVDEKYFKSAFKFESERVLCYYKTVICPCCLCPCYIFDPNNLTMYEAHNGCYACPDCK